MNRARLTLLAIAAAAIVTSCGEEPAPVATSPPASQPSVDPTVESTGADTAPSDERGDVVDMAVEDLAERLGIDPDEVEVVEHESVTWSDGSLGCPEPGMAYTQAIVEGTRTVLAAQDTTYRYHAGDGGDPFLCEEPELDPGRLTIPSDTTHDR